MKGAATIDDVARQAGVAISTVSHVINGTRFVSEETKQAVQKAIVATGYIPNSLARSLARSRTNTIGIALSGTSNPYFMELVYALAAECTTRKWMTLLADTKEDSDAEEQSVRQLHQQRVDGVILATCGDENSRSLAYLEQNRVPTVLVDRLVSRRFSQVGVENKHAMAQLVEHLYNLGHRRIAMIAGRPHVATTLERVNAYKRTLRGHGLPVDEALIHDGSEDAESFDRLLSLKPTAILAGNNRSMIRLMQYLHAAGLQVPRDIAVVGFDDFEWADYFHPRLTVIAQPIEAIAKRAISLLAACIEDPEAKPQTLHIKPKLIVRESCGSGNSRIPNPREKTRKRS
jgi:LacI family transcriptional regulator